MNTLFTILPAEGSFFPALLGGQEGFAAEEARVVPRLLRQAYSELARAWAADSATPGVSQDTTLPRWMTAEALADDRRLDDEPGVEPGREAGFDYPSVEEAACAVSLVRRYALHVARIGGNEWLAGFDARGFVATDPADAEAVAAAAANAVSQDMVEAGRVVWGVRRVSAQLPSFREWRLNAVARSEEGSPWRFKLGLASQLDDESLLVAVDNEAVKAELPAWLRGRSYPDADADRWETALTLAADAAWRRVRDAAPKAQERELKKLALLVAHSPRYAQERAAYLASPEYATEQLEVEVRAAERAAAEQLRQALLAQRQDALAQRVGTVAALKERATAIFAGLKSA
ncbi:MAG: hypothetical protein LBU11_12395 [Zoogloeaceae bacterium]|jgi:hypothetical protein|nr:hypothetical protein [Zoogloeaceae bacterium]